ncbi:MAG: hypothetical protein KBT29_00390 [Prevotellaceae bacterium]|nr:hypothetical protein [Candidatus Minthosoma caballi]
MRKLLFPTLAFLASSLFTACSSGSSEEHECHNEDIAHMFPSQLEHAATNAKCKECRYEALYHLYFIYKEKGTLYTLYDFAKKFPHSEFADSALAIVMPKSDSLYAEAIRLNTIDSWSDFVVQVPADLQHDALFRLDSLRWETQAHKWDTDDKAWHEASHLDQLLSYERYLSLYHNGTHVAEAEARKAEIEEYYWGKKQKTDLLRAEYDERQRQLKGDISNVGVWSVVDSLIAVHGVPTQYHYEAKGNSGIYLGEQYMHTFSVGLGAEKSLPELKKIYMKDFYKLWQNKHFNIIIQFRWEDNDIVVQQATSNGRPPKSQLKVDGVVTRLPSYKSAQTIISESNKLQ